MPVVTQASSVCLGEEKTQIMLYAFEKAIQDENDEQLRILNELGIEDKELRKMITGLRDKDYDTMSEAGRIPDGPLEN